MHIEDKNLIEKQTERHRLRNKEIDIDRNRERDRQTDRLSDRQIARQTDRQRGSDGSSPLPPAVPQRVSK